LKGILGAGGASIEQQIAILGEWLNVDVERARGAAVDRDSEIGDSQKLATPIVVYEA
jgi:hypothetical protein